MRPSGQPLRERCVTSRRIADSRYTDVRRSIRDVRLIVQNKFVQQTVQKFVEEIAQEVAHGVQAAQAVRQP